MRISRIQIENFRNFKSVDVLLGGHAVIVGPNRIGKSNLIHALRLVLDGSLPDSARALREEDFWDGLVRPLTKGDRVLISVDLTDFEKNPSQVAVLGEHLIQPVPMVSRLTYIWQPMADLEGDPSKDAHYEFLLFGGDRPENRIGHEVRRRLPFELVAALRDCEGDLARWTRSPLRPLLDNAATEIDRDSLKRVAAHIDAATGELTDLDQIRSISDAISDKLVDMVGPAQALDTALRFSPTDSDKLIRALRIFIDGGRRGIGDASLGSANLLYFALKSLEFDQFVKEGSRDHTFLGIEEPEAHLHPHLQRLLFRNYLRARGDVPGDTHESSTILMTTHSPHIASVTPLNSFIVLRLDADGSATEAVSTANLDLSDEQVADLERYIDVTRGELFFARGVILVEGDAERYLIPPLAFNRGIDLDELGIHVCAISGTDFYPYLTLLGPKGLDTLVVALTDRDPREVKDDGTARAPLGPPRVVNNMMFPLLDEKTWDDNDFKAVLEMAPHFGVFINQHTLEVDLFRCGLAALFAAAMEDLGTSKLMKARMQGWAKKVTSLDVTRFLADIETVGKGRFSQRLASIISESGTKKCPKYIADAIDYVKERCEID